MKRRIFLTHSTSALGLSLLAQNATAQDLNDQQKATTIQIKLTSVVVDDQQKALKFYTEILGFMKKQDVDLGMGPIRWITLVSPHDQDGTELALEPAGFPAAKTFQEAIFKMGVPYTAFAVSDIHKEYDRLTALAVKFRVKPTKMGEQMIAHFEDTCGNVIQLFQV